MEEKNKEGKKYILIRSKKKNKEYYKVVEEFIAFIEEEIKNKGWKKIKSPHPIEEEHLELYFRKDKPLDLNLLLDSLSEGKPSAGFFL